MAQSPVPAPKTLHCVPRGPLLQKHYTSFIATTTSCASPKASHQLRFVNSLVSLCSLDHPLLVFRTFPTLRPTNPSLDAWTYTPAASGVHLPVSSPRASAFPKAVPGRRSANFRATTSAREPISELQSFLYVQASRFACHPGRSHRCHFWQGGRGVYFRAPYELLPPHTSDMLAV